MVFISLTGLVPEYRTSKYIAKAKLIKLFSEGLSKKLVVSFPRTNYMKNSLSYSGTTLGNSLPCSVRESGSLNQFKRLLCHNF